MTIDKLIEEVNKAKKLKKEYDFSKHITVKYMPYSEKVALVKSVIANTSYIEVDGKKVYKRNTASMLFVFTMQLIQKYTDVEFEANDVVAAYDKLMESGIMNCLMTQIPEEEISILRNMLDMQRDDEEENTRSIVSFLETKANVLDIILGSLEGFLNKPEVQAKIAEMK